jgi:hypothetical protein
MRSVVAADGANNVFVCEVDEVAKTLYGLAHYSTRAEAFAKLQGVASRYIKTKYLMVSASCLSYPQSRLDNIVAASLYVVEANPTADWVVC